MSFIVTLCPKFHFNHIAVGLSTFCVTLYEWLLLFLFLILILILLFYFDVPSTEWRKLNVFIVTPNNSKWQLALIIQETEGDNSTARLTFHLIGFLSVCNWLYCNHLLEQQQKQQRQHHQLRRQHGYRFSGVCRFFFLNETDDHIAIHHICVAIAGSYCCSISSLQLSSFTLWPSTNKCYTSQC